MLAAKQCKKVGEMMGNACSKDEQSFILGYALATGELRKELQLTDEEIVAAFAAASCVGTGEGAN